MVSRVVLSVLAGMPVATAARNPLGEVVSLMTDLSAKVTADKEMEAKAYKEYFEWCDDMSTNKAFEIETASAQAAKLEATIEVLTAHIAKSDSKIEQLAADITAASADLAGATSIRAKEAEDFATGESELVGCINTLGRAITILEREMQTNPAAFAQVAASNDIAALMQSLGAVVDAASFSASDQQRLVALVQSQQAADDAEEDLGAPAAAVYKTHSTGILDLLADLQEKAEGHLSSLRKAELNAKRNYDLLKQSLDDQLAQDNKDMNKEKAAKSAAQESKSQAAGDLAVTSADLQSSQDALKSTQAKCLQVSADHAATVKARDEELHVIAEAIDILKATTSGAVSQSYSLLQLGVGIRTHADLAHAEVVTLVKKLARQQHSSTLAQLASRIAAVVRYGAASGDAPFAKVKGLIENMISKLSAQAASDATEKGYCDDELSKTTLKKGELEEDIAKQTSKIDQASARSAQLKAEVHELNGELAAMAKEQADSDKYRQDKHAEYVQAKADLELGLSGVRKALDMLRDYYGAGSALLQQPEPPMPELHGASTGAGNSIVGILEVVESDFAGGLVKEETEEADAQDAHDKATQEYKVLKTKKDQDARYKMAEATSQDKAIADISGDRSTTSTDYAAVMDYYGKLKERCIAKPETYEERKRRREAEIAGLKEALSVLESETAFVQRRGGKRQLRGSASITREAQQ